MKAFKHILLFLLVFLTGAARGFVINEQKYVFNINKVDEATVKGAFKDLFIAKSEDIFQTIWNNQNLRNNLFGTNINKANAKLDFMDLINELDDPNISNPILYSFIKVE